MLHLYPRLSWKPSCRELNVYGGIIGPRRKVPPVHGPETKPSLDFPGAPHPIASCVVDVSGEIGIQDAAHSIISSASKTRGVCKGCAFPTQPEVGRLQARRGSPDGSPYAQCAGPLEDDRGTYRLRLKI